MRSDRERLLDIVEAIERIEKHTSGGLSDFEGNELIQIWVLHHLQVIGEAGRGVSPELEDNHPEVAWSKIVGMRNVLVHTYFDVDLDITWSVVETDLPILKAQMLSILAELP